MFVAMTWCRLQVPTIHGTCESGYTSNSCTSTNTVYALIDVEKKLLQCELADGVLTLASSY